MKDIQLVISRSDVHDYVGGLWKTDIFRQSHQSGAFVHGIVDQFAKLPRLFCETTNDNLERAHFSTWWGAMMLRHDYDNPVIADLYLLHEMQHAGTMPYRAGLSHKAFCEKMEFNELGASVLSEIQVYFEMPGLRESSFAHPIYADRYLADPAMQALWRENREVAIETIKLMRRNIMIGNEHDLDIAELWIRKFNQQNAAYALVWHSRYDEIERHMVDFQNAAYLVGRREAIELHRDWLDAEADKDPIDHIPFREEAEISTKFYWKNKREYQAAMKVEADRLRQHMVTDPVLQQEIVRRILAKNIGDQPDCAIHSLGTIRLPGDRDASLHVRHAVDAVIVDDFGYVVLITREDNPGAGLKALPGIFIRSTGGPDGVEQDLAAIYRAAATETGIDKRVLENAQVIPLGPRVYDRSFDIRTAWADIPGTGIGAGDLFAVSTKGFCLRVKENLTQVPLKAGAGAKKVSVATIEGLTPDQFGIPDHLPMIRASKKAIADNLG